MCANDFNAYLFFFLKLSSESATTVRPVLRLRSLGGLGTGCGLGSCRGGCELFVCFGSDIKPPLFRLVTSGELTISNRVISDHLPLTINRLA